MDQLRDKRNLPIFIHSSVDELGLTIEAFRVYGYLARRAGSNNDAFPSYTRMGRDCFRGSYPESPENTLKRKAIDAVKELIAYGLIEKTSKSQAVNHYSLTEISEWKKPEKIDSCNVHKANTRPKTRKKRKNLPGDPGSPAGEPGSPAGEPGSPKGTPREITSKEVTPGRNINIGNTNISLEKKEQDFRQEKEDQEPVESNSRSLSKKQSDGRSKRKNSSETNVALAAKKLQKKKKLHELPPPNHQINDMGWVYLDQNPGYYEVRRIAIRRMQYLLYFHLGYGFASEDGKTVTIAGNQIMCRPFEGMLITEDECFSSSSHYNLATLRDESCDRGILSKDAFNTLLKTLFGRSAAWLREKGDRAPENLEKMSIISLFARSDLKLFESVVGTVKESA